MSALLKSARCFEEGSFLGSFFAGRETGRPAS